VAGAGVFAARRILVFIVPLWVVRLVLQPFFPIEHDWADFFYLMTFFALGYVLYAREEFRRAIRRTGRSCWG